MESRIKNNGVDAETETSAPKEGEVARTIESATSHVPSDWFLWASVASMLVSLGLQLSGNRRIKHVSTFFGQWAPTLLTLGVYNKLVKVAGHDRSTVPGA